MLFLINIDFTIILRLLIKLLPCIKLTKRALNSVKIE